MRKCKYCHEYVQNDGYCFNCQQATLGDIRYVDIRQLYKEAYEWADRQPSKSDDFILVPIESLQRLLEP